MRRIPHFSLMVLATLVAATASWPTTASSQNLLADPSFELGSVPHCDQAVVPDTWFTSTSTPDVYSFDCLVLKGLAPAAFTNFPALPAANDGLRFVAGGHFFGGLITEAFGQKLGAPLVAGMKYCLSGYFTLSHQHPQPGLVDIYLSEGTGWQGSTFMTTIGTGMVQDTWTFDDVLFTAPANAASLPNIIMVPRSLAVSPDTYLGTDSWSLRQVSDCAPTPTRSSTWGSVKAIYR